MNKKIDWNYWIIGIVAAVFFLPFLGGVHLFDWDEINFAECSREMILTGEYLRPKINFEAFWEKPPFFIWLQAISMHIFGVNEYAARFPNAICGIATLIIIYHIGKKLYNPTFGWLWVLSYFGTILPHLYFKSGIIDPWFNLFIFLSILFLIKSDDVDKDVTNTPSVWKGHGAYVIAGGIFSGLAILTKGPVGFLIAALTWAIKSLIFKELSWIKIKRFFIFSIIALSVTMLWFGIETIKNGLWFIHTFIEYNIRLAKTEDAGHGGFVGYHFVVILFGCFPASIFALRAFYKKYSFFNEKVNFTRWMKILFWVVIILFSFVQSKIVHYSSMCYLPLTFLSAITLKNILEDGFFFPFIKNGIIGIGILIGLVVGAIPFLGQNIDILKPLFNNDIFALKNLEADVQWSGWESLAGVFLILAVIALPFAIKRRGILRGYFHLFLVIGIFVNAVLILFINNIEKYSQNAAIEFYKSKASEDCYIATYGFKSYANLFYPNKRIPSNIQHSSEKWLMNGLVDKPTYFVAKYPSKNELSTKPQLEFLYEKNGFLFYRRR